MPEYKSAAITLTSLQDETRTVQQYQGQVFEAGGIIYVKYEEKGSSPAGEETIVRTTVKIAPGELKLMRHGSVESAQTFQAGRRLPGYYRAAYTSFNLSTDTHQLSIRLNGRTGIITWAYDLYVYEDLSGTFELSLHIQEEAYDESQSIRRD